MVGTESYHSKANKQPRGLCCDRSDKVSFVATLQRKIVRKLILDLARDLTFLIVTEKPQLLQQFCLRFLYRYRYDFQVLNLTATMPFSQ